MSEHLLCTCFCFIRWFEGKGWRLVDFGEAREVGADFEVVHGSTQYDCGGRMLRSQANGQIMRWTIRDDYEMFVSMMYKFLTRKEA